LPIANNCCAVSGVVSEEEGTRDDVVEMVEVDSVADAEDGL
jgi:hypothetical protein